MLPNKSNIKVASTIRVKLNLFVVYIRRSNKFNKNRYFQICQPLNLLKNAHSATEHNLTPVADLRWRPEGAMAPPEVGNKQLRRRNKCFYKAPKSLKLPENDLEQTI